MPKRFPWLMILALLCVCVGACGAVQERSGNELRLKGEAVAVQIEKGLEGTTGELNADRVDRNGTHHPGSYLQLGPGMGDRRFEFSLPDHVLDLGYGGTVAYRVNHVRLKSIGFASSKGEFVLTALFQSNDVALKGSHSWLGDAAVPDIKLDNPKLVVHLVPIVANGDITYDKPRVEFMADVDNTFIPRFTIAGQTIDVVDALTNYRRDLCNSIQTQIQKALDDPERKAALGRKIREGISGKLGSGGSVIGLRFQGTDLLVKFRE